MTIQVTYVILHEPSSVLSRPYPRRLRFLGNIAVAILKMREKIATRTVTAGRSVDIGFETSKIGNILQAFTFLDGERPLCRDKATKKRKVFACGAARARSIFRYPDIGSVSPHDVLASSWDTHPLFMEFIIRPQPALSPHRELPGDHLTGGFGSFHGDCVFPWDSRQGENPDPAGKSNSSFVCGETHGRLSSVIDCQRLPRS